MKAEHLPRLAPPSNDIFVESKTVFSFGLHTHTYYEMTLYEPFRGFILLNGRRIDVNGYTVTLVAPLDMHEITVLAPRGARYVKVAIPVTAVRAPTLPSSAVLSAIGQDDLLIRLFEEIFFSRKDLPTLEALTGCALYLTVSRGEAVTKTCVTAGDKLALSAVSLIHDCFSASFTLSDCASALSVTPEYLSSAFKASLGLTFSAYLTDVRLGYAQRLIEQTEESMTDICFASGYGDLSHFSRSFKKKFGESPSEHRRKKRPIL